MAKHEGPKRQQKILRSDGVEANYTVGSDTPAAAKVPQTTKERLRATTTVMVDDREFEAVIKYEFDDLDDDIKSKVFEKVRYSLYDIAHDHFEMESDDAVRMAGIQSPPSRPQQNVLDHVWWDADGGYIALEGEVSLAGMDTDYMADDQRAQFDALCGVLQDSMSDWTLAFHPESKNSRGVNTSAGTRVRVDGPVRGLDMAGDPDAAASTVKSRLMARGLDEESAEWEAEDAVAEGFSPAHLRDSRHGDLLSDLAEEIDAENGGYRKDVREFGEKTVKIAEESFRSSADYFASDDHVRDEMDQREIRFSAHGEVL